MTEETPVQHQHLARRYNPNGMAGGTALACRAEGCRFIASEGSNRQKADAFSAHREAMGERVAAPRPPAKTRYAEMEQKIADQASEIHRLRGELSALRLSVGIAQHYCRVCVWPVADCRCGSAGQ